MKRFIVVGFRKYSGQFEGKPYSGYYCHTTFDPHDPNFEGLMVKELKIKSKLNYIPCVDDVIDVEYDEFGICSIERVEARCL